MPRAGRGDRRPDDVGHSTRTRLTRAGFALYLAHLEGVDEANLHVVYGTPGMTSGSHSGRLPSSAMRCRPPHGGRDRDAAHLVRLKPGSMPPAALVPAADAVTLEAYREHIIRVASMPRRDRLCRVTTRTGYMSGGKET